MAYAFTNSWFEGHKASWSQVLEQLKPKRILEIGSYEGRSTSFLIDFLAKQRSIEIHCLDSWEGGIEHQVGGFVESRMADVEARFHHNIALAKRAAAFDVNIFVHKGQSNAILPRLIAEGKQEYFDFIYVDGSHQAPDVLIDAVLSFQLLRLKGIIVFDDYLWQEPLLGGPDPIRCPKTAIDAFTTIYCRKLKIIQAPLAQLYVQKTNH